MSVFSIFENLRFNGRFWRNVWPYISGYLLMFIFSLLGVWIAYGLDANLMQGFTLFTYFPSWLRFVCLNLITSFLIAIPLGIIAGFFISMSYNDLRGYILESIREELKINCIECSNQIMPQGTWFNGQTDIRCNKCGCLMTITIEESRFKKLILKEPRTR